MNLRITTLFFGILLTMLWVFGLLVAQRKTAVDQSFIVPSLQRPDTKIESILIQKSDKEGPEIEFVQKDERWYLSDGKQQVRVEGFRIEQIITQIKEAKHEESSDIPKDAGLKNPQMVVTLKGKHKEDAKEWKLFVGKESVDKNLIYVNSSERSDKVFAISKKSIENLFFKDPNYQRSKRIFDFMETAVTNLDLHKDGKEVELKRSENNLWSFVKPALGFAGFDNPPEERKEDKFNPKTPPPQASGVKNLLNSVANIRVDDESDFVPLGKPLDHFGLETDKKTRMRIIISSSGDKKEVGKEILFIGKQVPDRKEIFYYARLASDDGVMQINEKWLKPIDEVIKDPGKIRSLDVAVFDPKAVDAITIQHGKELIQFFKPNLEPNWQMVVGSEKKKPDQLAVQNLIDQMQGKKAIIDFEFDQLSEADLKKRETEVGLDASAPEIAVFMNAIEKDKKDEKKEEIKDEKKEEIKDEKKEAKTESKKTDVPSLKKDAKAVVKMTIGKTEKEIVHVKRTLQDGTVSYFTLKKDFVDKILPSEGPVLAYLDTSLPTFTADEVSNMEVMRTTEKGIEKLELERRGKLWYVRDPLESTGVKPADSNKVVEVVKFLSGAHVKKWLQNIDDKVDLDKFGLKNPVAQTTFHVKMHPINASAAASILGNLVSGLDTVLAALGNAIAQQEADKGESVTIKFGKETDQDKDKPGVFAQHSGSNLLFLVPPQLLKELKEVDLRDRSHTMNAQPQMIASLLGSIMSDPQQGWLFASPYLSGTIHQFDPDQVKEIQLAIRTPYELRSFGFKRNAKDAKDKTWTDSTGLQEFQLDSDKVTQLVKDLGKLKTERFAAFAGGVRSEHKLGAKEFSVKMDITLDDGKTITLTIGSSYRNLGYFANSSVWPETVYFVPSSMVEPLLRGVSFFSKEHATAAN